jgi:two-component system KDP operon response regulator KdpE
MGNKPMILVVEDDAAVRNLMAVTLETRGYRYHLAQNGAEALIEATTHQPDVMLLDLGLPDLDGVEIIRKVRSWSNIPIIVISARSEDSDKVEALDAGADDYLTKPFSVDEMLARLRVALRRINSDQQAATRESNLYENGSLRIDYAAGCAYIGEEEVHLTPIEYRLLCLLAKNTGKVLTHNYILKEIWGSFSASEVGSLRVFMAMLRKKLQTGEGTQPYIQTHIGIGYRMLRQERNPENTP